MFSQKISRVQRKKKEDAKNIQEKIQEHLQKVIFLPMISKRDIENEQIFS